MTATALPEVGLGFKPLYFEEAVVESCPGIWWEIHPENYAVSGGPRWRVLDALRANHPLSLHGVSLSLAGTEPLAPERLQMWTELNRRLQPALVSEHLAWSWWQGHHAPDLLPVRRTQALLQRLLNRIDTLQNALGRPIALENPSHYVPLIHECDEVDFLNTLSRRSGCHLLVDVNNVIVSCHNLNTDPQDWIARIDATSVVEIHLAGHHADPLLGDQLWIDSHDCDIGPNTWDLYARLLQRIGPRPTLIERDDHLPAYAQLLAEVHAARALWTAASAEVHHG